MENNYVEDYMSYDFNSMKERSIEQLGMYLKHKFPTDKIEFNKNYGLTIDTTSPNFKEIMEILTEIGFKQD